MDLGRDPGTASGRRASRSVTPAIAAPPRARRDSGDSCPGRLRRITIVAGSADGVNTAERVRDGFGRDRISQRRACRVLDQCLST